jgi:tubulin-specific chaperone D
MRELMAGYTSSADTGNEDLVITSRQALTEFCEESEQNLDLVCDALFQNLKAYHGQDRITVSTLEVVAFLFHVGLFQRAMSVDLRSLAVQVQKAAYKTGNVRKIEACIKVYGGIAALEDSGLSVSMPRKQEGIEEARKRLGALMYHPWPKVKSMVVDELWGILDGKDPEAARQLTSTDWAKAEKSHIRGVVEELGLC